MKTTFKRIVIWLYCHRLISAAATAYLFNKINMKGA